MPCHRWRFRRFPISIHALREEGDLLRSPSVCISKLFLSTPSARRATLRHPRPPAHQGISIHALREEGDKKGGEKCIIRATFLSTPSARRATVSALPKRDPAGSFLSTPSARRATNCIVGFNRQRKISIHALREEGDNYIKHSNIWYCDFYPRPPRGGRHDVASVGHILVRFLSTPSARRATISKSPPQASFCYFYPRPPRGGRLSQASCNSCDTLFLSTPSARRAT